MEDFFDFCTGGGVCGDAGDFGLFGSGAGAAIIAGVAAVVGGGVA